MEDLFGGDSLSVRKARKSKKRGPLEWSLTDSHHPPSFISELLYWYTYYRREKLCRSNVTLDPSLIDPVVKKLITTCTIVHPVLTRARYYEITLGLRFSKQSVAELIELNTFPRDLQNCYSYSLCYLLLERETIVSQWPDPPTEYSVSQHTVCSTHN
jgi:hypothetical protein